MTNKKQVRSAEEIRRRRRIGANVALRINEGKFKTPPITKGKHYDN